MHEATLTATPTATRAAAQLRDILPSGATIHPRPTGTAVDACTWCDLTDPEPAVVTFAGTDTPAACLWCATTAARHAIEAADRDTDIDLIHADVLDIEAPVVLSEQTDDVPAPARRWFISERGVYIVQPYRNAVHETDEHELVDRDGTTFAFTTPADMAGHRIVFTRRGETSIDAADAAEYATALGELAKIAGAA